MKRPPVTQRSASWVCWRRMESSAEKAMREEVEEERMWDLSSELSKEVFSDL